MPPSAAGAGVPVPALASLAPVPPLSASVADALEQEKARRATVNREMMQRNDTARRLMSELEPAMERIVHELMRLGLSAELTYGVLDDLPHYRLRVTVRQLGYEQDQVHLRLTALTSPVAGHPRHLSGRVLAASEGPSEGPEAGGGEDVGREERSEPITLLLADETLGGRATTSGPATLRTGAEDDGARALGWIRQRLAELVLPEHKAPKPYEEPVPETGRPGGTSRLAGMPLSVRAPR